MLTQAQVYGVEELNWEWKDIKFLEKKQNSYDLRINLFVIVSQNGTNLLRDNLGDVMYGTIYIRGSSNEKV